MDIIFQKVSSPKCIKPMELNFQFAGVTDHIFSHELSKWLNLFVLLFLYKKGDFSNYKDANVKVDVDIFYAHVNIVHIVDVDIAHHENEQLLLLMMMMAVLRLFFALKRELLNYLRLSETSGFQEITFTFHVSQKPSLSFSLLLFKYVSFPRAVSVQDGMVVLDWKFDDVNGTYNTTHFEVGFL